jgi:hypothetical protein
MLAWDLVLFCGALPPLLVTAYSRSPKTWVVLFLTSLSSWVFPHSAVPWETSSQEAVGDAAGVVGKPPPGQDPLQCCPRPGQQQDAGEPQTPAQLGCPYGLPLFSCT